MVLLPVANQKQPSRGFFTKGILKMCSKFAGEHPFRSVISLQLYQNHASARVKCVGNLQNTRAKV